MKLNSALGNRCPKCGRDVLEGAAFCGICGTSLKGNSVFYVKLKGYPGAPKQVTANANEVNRFSVGTSQSGMGLTVSRVDVIDSD